MSGESENEGTLELVIHCHKCKANFQLNPMMIAASLVTKADVWEVYNYILTVKCRNCKET